MPTGFSSIGGVAREPSCDAPYLLALPIIVGVSLSRIAAELLIYGSLGTLVCARSAFRPKASATFFFFF